MTLSREPTHRRRSRSRSSSRTRRTSPIRQSTAMSQGSATSRSRVSARKRRSFELGCFKDRSFLAPISSRVQVGIRVRQGQGQSSQHVRWDDVKQTVTVNSKSDDMARVYPFDEVFGPQVDQQEIYSRTAKQITEKVLMGFNGCFLAYGQTGAGKTYTTFGDMDTHEIESQGVFIQALADIFNHVRKRPEESWKIHLSMLQIYKDDIYDLLAEKPWGTTLPVREHVATGVYVPGLTEAEVPCMDTLKATLKRGYNRRAVGSTLMNELSSRSHTVLLVTTSHTPPLSRTSSIRLKSRLYCVDLAGSERVKKVGSIASEERLGEAKAVNASLACLGNVIAALANQSSHVPYRDCKLTRILQDCLGGGCATSMLVHIHASDRELSETISSLRFAQRAMQVQTQYKPREIEKDLNSLLMSNSPSSSVSSDTTEAMLLEREKCLKDQVRMLEEHSEREWERTMMLRCDYEAMVIRSHDNKVQSQSLSVALKAKEGEVEVLQRQLVTSRDSIEDLKVGLDDSVDKAVSSVMDEKVKALHKLRQYARKLKERDSAIKILQVKLNGAVEKLRSQDSTIENLKRRLKQRKTAQVEMEEKEKLSQCVDQLWAEVISKNVELESLRSQLKAMSKEDEVGLYYTLRHVSLMDSVLADIEHESTPKSDPPPAPLVESKAPNKMMLRLSSLWAGLCARQEALVGDKYRMSELPHKLEHVWTKLGKEEVGHYDAKFGGSVSEGRSPSWLQVALAYFFLVLSIIIPGAHHLHMRNWKRAGVYLVSWNLIGVGWWYDVVSLTSDIYERKVVSKQTAKSNTNQSPRTLYNRPPVFRYLSRSCSPSPVVSDEQVIKVHAPGMVNARHPPAA